MAAKAQMRNLASVLLALLVSVAPGLAAAAAAPAESLESLHECNTAFRISRNHCIADASQGDAILLVLFSLFYFALTGLSGCFMQAFGE